VKKKAATVSKKKERKKKSSFVCVCVCVWYGSWGIISRGESKWWGAEGRPLSTAHVRRASAAPFSNFIFFFSFLGWNKSIDTRGGKKKSPGKRDLFIM
jgi:hypothetical protein